MKTLIHMRILKRASVMRQLRAVVAAFGLLAVLAVVSGCSSSSTPVQVESITFTDVNGKTLTSQPTTLSVGQTVWASVDLINDPELLGVDWTVYCGSALSPGTPLPTGQTEDTSCGSFTPTHTLGGPKPDYVKSPSGYIALYAAPLSVPKQGTVTIYATATKDRSKVSSVTLTITQ